MAKLTKKDINFIDIIRMSYEYYGEFDDKIYRMGLDVNNVYIISRFNHKYDRKLRRWVQTGRDVKIIFNVISRPVSYSKQDTIAIHKYPVTFLIHNIEKGLQSSFKWRTGSLKKPLFYKSKFKGKNLTNRQKKVNSRERIRIINQNIKNGVQLDFFFNLEAVLKQYDLLYGINYAKWLPKQVKNPPKNKNIKHIPYFDKTALYVYIHYLQYFFKNSEILNKIK